MSGEASRAAVELFCLQLPSVSAARELPNHLLTPAEQREAQELLPGDSRAHFVLARGFVRACLGNVLRMSAASVPIDRRAKPRLRPAALASEVEFSVAKTDGLVVCAVGIGGPIGVDVEHLGRSVAELQVAERYFSARESSVLRALPGAQRRRRFFELWVLKEAHSKALGLGLELPLDHCAFDFCSDLSIDTSRGDPRWCYSLLQPSAAHLLALAVPRCFCGRTVRQTTYVAPPPQRVPWRGGASFAPRLEYFASLEAPIERRLDGNV